MWLPPKLKSPHLQKAKLRAMVESINSFYSGLTCLFLVCTKEECRYKLWGITVALMIPMAIYAASFGIEGIKPKLHVHSGCAKIISKIKKPHYHNQSNANPFLRIPLLIKTIIKKCPKP
jgi:hypothetical protein